MNLLLRFKLLCGINAKKKLSMHHHLVSISRATKGMKHMMAELIQRVLNRGNSTAIGNGSGKRVDC